MQHVVSYLDRMKAANESASKLLRIAETFTQIAAVLLRKHEKPSHNSRKRSYAAMAVNDPNSMINKIDDAKRPNLGPRMGSSSNTEVIAPQEPEPEPESSAAAAGRPSGSVPPLFPHAFNFIRWPNFTGAPARPGSSQENKAAALPNPIASLASLSSMDTPFSLDALSGLFDSATAGGFDFDLEALMGEPNDFQNQIQQAHRQGPLDFDWYQWDQFMQDSPRMSINPNLANMK